jgi:hypothetical protein
MTKMAEPAFIYAVDSLGPERFTELCGRLLGARHKGFLLGGVGPDGGVDGELDAVFGEWYAESKGALLNEIIGPNQTVIFQFKHIVAARAGGQAQMRNQLLSLYKCRKSYTCELHRRLVVQKSPNCYVLVTNVEVNSNFRAAFVKQCTSHNPSIGHYQVIGLDELVDWVAGEVELRHLYFPAIFGPPRFNLQVKTSDGIAVPHYGGPDFGEPIPFFYISVLNVGVVPSYVNSISFKAIVDGNVKSLQILNIDNPIMRQINPEFGTILEPGRKQVYSFPLGVLREMKAQGDEVFPFEVVVCDEIGNVYRAAIPEGVINKILE